MGRFERTDDKDDIAALGYAWMLTCSRWQGVTICQAPVGYTSIET